MNPRFFRNGIVMLALVVVALAVVYTVVSSSTPAKNTAYSEFLDNVQAAEGFASTPQDQERGRHLHPVGRGPKSGIAVR